MVSGQNWLSSLPGTLLIKVNPTQLSEQMDHPVYQNYETLSVVRSYHWVLPSYNDFHTYLGRREDQVPGEELAPDDAPLLLGDAQVPRDVPHSPLGGGGGQTQQGLHPESLPAC